MLKELQAILENMKDVATSIQAKADAAASEMRSEVDVLLKDRRFRDKSIQEIEGEALRARERAGTDPTTILRREAKTARKALAQRLGAATAAVTEAHAARRRLSVPDLPLPLKQRLDTQAVYGGDSLQLAILRELCALNTRQRVEDTRRDFGARPPVDQLDRLEVVLAEARALEATLRPGHEYAAMREGERLLFKGETPRFADHDAAAMRRHALLVEAHTLETLVAAQMPPKDEANDMLVSDAIKQARARLEVLRESRVDDATREAEAAERAVLMDIQHLEMATFLQLSALEKTLYAHEIAAGPSPEAARRDQVNGLMKTLWPDAPPSPDPDPADADAAPAAPAMRPRNYADRQRVVRDGWI